MRKSPIACCVINLGCRRSTPLPSADGSLLGQRPDAGSRWEVTASIQKAWTALPVQGAPPSQVSVFTQMSPFPSTTDPALNGCLDMRRARLCPWTSWRRCPMAGSVIGSRPWRNGTTHAIFEPLEFLEKLAALVPTPRAHLVRFHGLLAPAAK